MDSTASRSSLDQRTYLQYNQDNTMPGTSTNNLQHSNDSNAAQRRSLNNNLGSKYFLARCIDLPTIRAANTLLPAETYPSSFLTASKEDRGGSNSTSGSASLTPDAARSGRSSMDDRRGSTGADSSRRLSQDMRYKVDAEARHKGIKEKLLHNKVVPDFLK